MNASHFHRLFTLVLFEIGRFEKALARLQSTQYPSRSPKGFIQLLINCLKTHRLALNEIREDYSHDPLGGGARLKSEHRKLVEKFTYLEILDNSKTDEVPWSLIPGIERVAGALIPGRRILTSSTSDLNYQISWNTRLPVEMDTYFILLLPKVHRANAFLHLLVGHELFHPLVDTFVDGERAGVQKLLKEKCSKLLKSADDDLFKKTRLDQLVLAAEEVWEFGLKELMCDMGCAAIFGPAGVLSASLFASTTHSLDESPTRAGNYPPWRMRLRTMIRYAVDSDKSARQLTHVCQVLEDHGFKDERDRFLAAITNEREIVALETDRPVIQSEPIVKIVYEEIEACLDRAWEFVQSTADKSEDCWGQSVSQLPHLLKSLRNAVPPGEVRVAGQRIGVPASISAIANASWIHFLSLEFEDDGTRLVEEFKKTCRLMLKAFEDSELIRHFQSKSAMEGAHDDSVDN